MIRLLSLLFVLFSSAIGLADQPQPEQAQSKPLQSKKLNCENNDALACKAENIGKKIDQQTKKNDEKLDQIIEGND